MAILTADIEGFSSQMRQDEAAVVQLLLDFYFVARDVVRGHGGDVFRREGDAIWCKFPESLPCLRAAAELHRSLDSYNQNLPEADRFRIRMGAHYGEVTVTDDGDLLGHTLSVAKRLETACPPGGVMVTDSFHHQVVNQRTNLQFQHAGLMELKGVGAVDTYVWRNAKKTQSLSPRSKMSAWDAPLADPGQYGLKIVQAAVACHANRVDFKVGRQQAQIVLDCAALAALRPLKLRSWVIDGPKPGETLPEPFRDLISGIRAARQLRPFRLEWTTWAEGHGQSLVFDAQDHYRLEENRAKGSPTTCRLSLTRTAGMDFLAFLRQRPKETLTEHRAAQRCRFSSVPCWLDGRPLFSPRLEELSEPGWLEALLSVNFNRRYLLVERILTPTRPHLDLLAVDPPESRRASVRDLGQPAESGEKTPGLLLYQSRKGWNMGVAASDELPEKLFPGLRFQIGEKPDPRPVACSVALGLPVHLEGEGRLVPVKAGVALPMQRVDLGCPGVVAVVSACGLTVDPARLELVEDRHYRQRLEFVRRHVQEMLNDLRDHLHLLPDGVRNYVQRKLP